MRKIKFQHFDKTVKTGKTAELDYELELEYFNYKNIGMNYHNILTSPKIEVMIVLLIALFMPYLYTHIQWLGNITN